MVVHLNCVNFRHNLSIFNKGLVQARKFDGVRPLPTGFESRKFSILHKFYDYGKPEKAAIRFLSV
mgnify:CR=1 FL=1